MENQAPDTREVTAQSFVLAHQTKEQPPASASVLALTMLWDLVLFSGNEAWVLCTNQTYRVQRIAVGSSVYDLPRGWDAEDVWLAELDCFLALGGW